MSRVLAEWIEKLIVLYFSTTSRCPSGPSAPLFYQFWRLCNNVQCRTKFSSADHMLRTVSALLWELGEHQPRKHCFR